VKLKANPPISLSLVENTPEEERKINGKRKERRKEK